MSARKRREPASASISDTLTGLIDPRLFGAACIGHHELFDAERDHERTPEREARHAAACLICAQCPVIAACRQVAAENRDHVAGVWAGRVHTKTTTPQQEPSA
jgi:hypothetical protein